MQLQFTFDTPLKICKICKRQLPNTEFHKHKRSPDRLRYECKQCRSQAKPKPVITEKACKWCRIVKPLDQFYTRISKLTGSTLYYPQCKTCELERTHNHRIENLDAVKKQERLSYKRTADKRCEYSRNYWAQHTEKRRELYREWRKRNLVRCRALSIKRKTQKIGNGGSYTAEEWIALCEKYENKCLCCGKAGIKLTVDHVLPVTQGGKSDITNLQPLCKSCNSKKYNKYIDFRY